MIDLIKQLFHLFICCFFLFISFPLNVRMIVDSQLVWVRDSTEGYIQGLISEIGAAEFEVIPSDRKYPKRICSVDDIFPSCDGPQDHDDNCK